MTSDLPATPTPEVTNGTKNTLGRTLGSVIDVGRELLAKRKLAIPAKANPAQSLLAMCAELLNHRGEASGLALASDIAQRYLDLPEVDGVIAQLEVPMDTLVRVAENHPGFFCLNAAPARPVSAAVLAHTDLLVVNELEAEAIGPSLADYSGWLAVTYGAAGAELTREGSWVASSEAPRVDSVSSVGAGDAFTASLAVCLMQSLEPQLALERACAAGAIATTRHGAQCGPTGQEIEQLLGATSGGL